MTDLRKELAEYIATALAEDGNPPTADNILAAMDEHEHAHATGNPFVLLKEAEGRIEELEEDLDFHRELKVNDDGHLDTIEDRLFPQATPVALLFGRDLEEVQETVKRMRLAE